MKRIVCFHLFNDYSGSPKVLKMVLEGLLKQGVEVDLVSSKSGVLDELLSYQNLHKHSYSYRFSINPAVTMLRYTVIQVYTFLLSFRWLFSKGTVFYINTLLPAGPALAGRLMGKRVIYHYHENAFAKGLFYKFLAKGMQTLATKIICVSGYQRSFLNREKNVYIVPNSIPTTFVSRLRPNISEAFERKTVLMLGSLKRYKGTQEFIELAQRLDRYQFELVLNENMENITGFCKANHINQPANLTMHPRQEDVVPFYNRASIVLNLTDKYQAIETFGLTALEAMSAGLPVIVPTVGGIADMVDDGVNGYKTDVQDLDKIQKQISMLLSDEGLYKRLASNALRYSRQFSEENMINRINSIL